MFPKLCKGHTEYYFVFKYKRKGDTPLLFTPSPPPPPPRNGEKKGFICVFILFLFFSSYVYIYSLTWDGGPLLPPPPSAYGLKTTKQQSMQTVPHPKMISITASDVTIGETKKFNQTHYQLIVVQPQVQLCAVLDWAGLTPIS